MAEQEANSTEERESVLPDERVAEIAPPFSDEQDMNVRLLNEIDVKLPVRLSTAPFPEDRVIEEKELSLNVRAAPEVELWIRGRLESVSDSTVDALRVTVAVRT